MLRRRLLSVVVSLTAVCAALGAEQSPAVASVASVATYPVMNTSETPPDGVWFRNSPANGDTSRENGFGVYAGEHLAVDCYSWGDPVGPYANHIWYRGLDTERPNVNGHSNYGYMNTHYVNDGMTADHPAPGIPDCSAPPPPPPPSVTACTFNLRWSNVALTFNYGGAHTYYGNAWQAAKNWTNLGLPLSVVPAASGVVGQITFTDVNRPNANWDGQAQITDKTPYTSHLGTYTNPVHISIYLNTAKMAGRSDFQRTLVATHELGHALGLAHPDAACGVTAPSIMNAAGQRGATTNTPLYYDRINLEQLYGWPTG